MKSAHMPFANFYHRHFAHLQGPATVVKELPFAWKGDVITAEIIRDYIPGMYGFTSVEKRDKFVTMINTSNELRPCVAVLLQGL